MPDLETALRDGCGGSDVIAADDLDRLWWGWFDDSYGGRRGRDTFLAVLRYLDTGADPDAELSFRLGGWEIDLGKTAVQAGLVSAFIGGILAVMGVDHVPVQVVPAVMPLVFDIRRSRLTASQEYVLAELVVQSDVRDGSLTAAELYGHLSAETRDAISRTEFEDFLDACRRAGVSDRDGDTIALSSADKAKFRITFR